MSEEIPAVSTSSHSREPDSRRAEDQIAARQIADDQITNDQAVDNQGADNQVADAQGDNWIYSLLPSAALPFAQLARLDRPVGAWLLLFPCWWSQGLASSAAGAPYPDIWHLALFLIGAFVMRGAGCTYNDIVDRDIDAGVARTKSRPLPSGRVTTKAAFAFALGLCLIGLLVLLQFNRFTIVLGMASLILVAIYPFMKRFTYWPQLVLGLTFNWGALVGWSATRGTLELPALFLYAGCILWTVGYDTIYAHQDKEDDLSLGLKSTALRFADQTHIWLSGFYGAAWVLWIAAIVLAGSGIALYAALTLAGLHLLWQIATLDISDADNCLRRFRANVTIGWLLFIGVLLDMAVRQIA